MSFRQVYYTSCETGLRGTKGFQVNAATPGLEQGVLQQIERLGLYVPPLSAPTRPTDDDLLKFPVSLIYQRLPDGSAVVAQARYLGPDYSGRHGNYFTHSLVADGKDAAFRDCLPVELWKSPSWVTVASPSTTLEPLPQPAPGEISPESIQAFVKDPARSAVLPAFLSAVEEALRSSRRVLVVAPPDRSADVALWIAAATCALPRSLSLKVTFSTYVKNPYQSDVLVAGITPDSDFTFAAHELQHQFSVFDFVGGRNSPSAPISVMATRLANAYLRGSTAEIPDFVLFCDDVAPGLALADLETAYDAYALSAGLTPAPADLARVGRWCASQAARMSPARVKAVFSALAQSDPSNIETVKATAELYLAAEGARTAIERRFVRWLLLEVLPVGPAAALSPYIAGLKLPASAIETAGGLREDWMNRLGRETDAARRILFLQLGERLDFLNDAAFIQQLGQDVIGPALSDPAIHALLRRLAAGPHGAAVVAGVAAYLTGHVKDAAPFRGLAALNDDGILQRLRKEALAVQGAELYLRLTALTASAAPERRRAAFEECLKALPAAGIKLNPTLADQIVAALWQGRGPDAREGAEIISSLPERGWSKTQLIAGLFETLQTGIDLRRDDPDRVALAKALARFVGDDEPRGTILEVLHLASQLRAPGGKVVTKLLGLSLYVGPALASKVLDVVAERIAAEREVPLHLEMLQGMARTGNPEAFQAYSRAVERRLAARREPEAVALYWRVWIPASLPESSQLRELLARMLQTWSNRDLRAASNALASSPRERRTFDSWCEEQFDMRSLLDRAKSWLFPGAVVLLLLIVAAIGHRVWAARLDTDHEDAPAAEAGRPPEPARAGHRPGHAGPRASGEASDPRHRPPGEPQ